MHYTYELNFLAVSNRALTVDRVPNAHVGDQVQKYSISILSTVSSDASVGHKKSHSLPQPVSEVTEVVEVLSWCCKTAQSCRKFKHG